VLRALVGATVLSLVLAPSALGGRLGLAEIRRADGALIAQAGDGAFAYPANGSVLTVGSAAATADGVELRDVSLLGGRIQVGRLDVPAQGTGGASVDGLIVDGLLRHPRANEVIGLDGGDYLVVLQQATVPGAGTRRAGTVGLRLFLAGSYFGLPAGTQLLIGLARATAPARAVPASATYDLLGLAAAPAPGLVSVQEPWLAHATTGTRAVAIAERYLGVPYRWGGADPSGFDCSGLMMYVYRQLGVGLLHYSGAQFNEGARVPPDELRPGDLVFFEPGPLGPGHVGMYVGNGSFIQAPHTGDVVKISSLSDTQYALSYVGAVRPYAPA
jgi:cell wall-associated NlpC family hydrolase